VALFTGSSQHTRILARSWIYLQTAVGPRALIENENCFLLSHVQQDLHRLWIGVQNPSCTHSVN
jgi:hypothetical protein